MSSKTKTKTPTTVTIAPEAVSGKPVKGMKRVNKDGTPFVPAPRRPTDVILADWRAKREKVAMRHASELAKIDARIDFFANGRGSRAIDPATAQAAAEELIAGGMTPDAIVALEAKLRAAKSYIKNAEPEALAALINAPVPTNDESEA